LDIGAVNDPLGLGPCLSKNVLRIRLCLEQCRGIGVGSPRLWFVGGVIDRVLQLLGRQTIIGQECLRESDLRISKVVW
jgi:hypothetical protein